MVNLMAVMGTDEVLSLAQLGSDDTFPLPLDSSDDIKRGWFLHARPLSYASAKT